MIDLNYIDQNTVPVMQPKKHRSIVALTLSLVCLISIFLIAFLLWFNISSSAQINKLIEHNSKLQTLLDASVVETKLVSNDVVQLQANMKAYITELQAQQLMINDLSKINQNPSLHLKLAHIENLVNIAETKLKSNNDIEYAKSVLTIADNYLVDEHHPQLISLRKNILNFIQQLEKVKAPDVLKVSKTLDKFTDKINNLDALDLMLDKQKYLQAASMTTPAPSKETTDWRGALNNFKDNLLTLVAVHKLDQQHADKLNRLLSDEQIANLKLYFKLKTAGAINSVQQYDAANFESAIKVLENDVSLYFANNDNLKTQLLDLLKECQNINLAITLPDLSDLYSDIRKMNK